MMRFGIPPFSKPNKATKKAEAAQAPSGKTAVDEPATLHPADSAAPANMRSARKTVPTAAGRHDAVRPPDPDEERKLARLSSIYEQMPAEEAGRILVKLPDPFVEKLLSRMDERQVGKLLLTFDADRAARLTRALAR
jgi:hypothetical protein